MKVERKGKEKGKGKGEKKKKKKEKEKIEQFLPSQAHLTTRLAL